MAPATTTDLAVLMHATAPAGKDVVDVGCGGGELVRELAALGARVTGVEISERRVADAIAADAGAGAAYRVGRGEELPIADASADVVVFMRTLHHVPVAAMGGTLREARRVLRRGGLLYVAEPLTHGEYFELTSLVEDELAVRTAAQDALDRAGEAGLQHVNTVDYAIAVQVAGLAGLRERMVRVDPDRAEVFDARAAEIGDALGRLGEPGERPGERRLVSMMRARLMVHGPS